MNVPWWAWLLLIPAITLAAAVAAVWWVMAGIRFVMTGALELDDEGEDDA